MPNEKELMEMLNTAIKNAYEKSEKTATECQFVLVREQKPDFNMSDIITLLVQEAGRYAERYASDVVISINSMMNDLNTNPWEHIGETYLFGIRRNGVDHLEFVRCQMESDINNFSHFDEYYRKIYAVKLEIKDDENDTSNIKRATVTMKEIRSELSHELWAIGK